MTELAYISVDNRFVPLAEARIPILDRGVLFADAVYEVIRVYQGKPFFLREHVTRLRRNLKTLKIPDSVCEKLDGIVAELIARSELQEARIYIQISRGIGRRQLLPDEQLTPTIFAYIESLNLKSITGLQENGIRLQTQQDLRWGRCDVKSTGLLANILAHQAAREEGADDALLVDRNGFIRETTQASFFLIHEGRLLLPPADSSLLPGITRSIVVRLMERLQMPIVIRKPTKEDLFSADEAFVTATTIEVVPVTRIDDQMFSAFKREDSLTRRLQKAYKEFVHEYLSRR